MALELLLLLEKLSFSKQSVCYVVVVLGQEASAAAATRERSYGTYVPLARGEGDCRDPGEIWGGGKQG